MIQNKTLLLYNCKLFSGKEAVIRDILIMNGKIKQIGKDIQGSFTKRYNADQNIVMPGIIDSHVHFRFPGQTHKETWKAATMSAAAGGVTTILDMPNNIPPTLNYVELCKKRKHASENSIVNYGFHFGACHESLEDVDNVASVKFFFGETTGSEASSINYLEKLMQCTDKLITVHAEDMDIIENNKTLIKDGTHSQIRDNRSEDLAVEKILRLVDKYKHPVYFCHISSKEAIGRIAKAKSKGLPVFCEITPHHLLLEDDGTTFMKVNPPLRSSADREALAIELPKVVDVIASDHAPHSLEEKQSIDPPSGVPGVETMLPLMFDSMSKGMLPIKDIVRLMSKNPSKIFGIQNKGRIAVGYDADIVLVDGNLEKTVIGKDMHSLCGWTPYEGMALKGWPVTTIVNGNIVFDHGRFRKNRGKEVRFKN